MGRVLAFIYGLIAYAAFLAAILYAIGFLGRWVVPKHIDGGPAGPVGQAIVVNVLLLLLFAIQHTIMARPAFKTWWTRLVPTPIERSTFVLFASLLLLVLYWQWRAMPTIVWVIENPQVRGALIALSLAGWAVVFYSSFLIDHFDLFGLRQVFFYLCGRPYEHPSYMERSLYRLIRHPLMAGFIIAFWATPTMSQGHLLFAAVASAYIFFGTMMEERDLVKLLGDDYRRYRKRTPMILPIPKGRISAESRREL